jgi:hypothetical protein
MGLPTALAGFVGRWWIHNGSHSMPKCNVFFIENLLPVQGCIQELLFAFGHDRFFNFGGGRDWSFAGINEPTYCVC